MARLIGQGKHRTADDDQQGVDRRDGAQNFDAKLSDAQNKTDQHRIDQDRIDQDSNTQDRKAQDRKAQDRKPQGKVAPAKPVQRGIAPSHCGFEDSARGRILSAAAHLFRAKGFERTTVRDLATAVGIQSGSIFHHFKTKEEILRQVMIEVILFNTGRMRAALAAAKTPQERVLALLQCELQSINGETGEAMAVLIYEWRSLSEQSQQDILKLRDVYEQMWLDTLDDARSRGLIHHRVDTFILRRFLTGALSWSNFWYHPEGSLSIEAVAEQALHLVVKYVPGD